jgi:hypothetical protein
MSLHDQHERHDKAQEAARLERCAREKRQADHDAENRKRSERAGPQHDLIGNAAYLFHDRGSVAWNPEAPDPQYATKVKP